MSITNTRHHRRLDRLASKLNVPVGDDGGRGNPSFVLQLGNVPDLAAACERAKRADAGAATVFFAPMSGAVQRADCGAEDGLSAGVVLAFEGPAPTPDQITRVNGGGELVAFARPELGECVGLSCAGGLLFWVGVSLEEIP